MNQYMRNFLIATLISILYLSSSFLIAAEIVNGKTHKFHIGNFKDSNQASLLYQSIKPNGLHGISSNNGGVNFNDSTYAWIDGHLGFDWNVGENALHVGRFGSDDLSDVLLQPQKNGVVAIFETDARGKLEQIKSSWGTSALGVDWTAEKSNFIPGDFDGDGNTELFIQGKNTESLHSIAKITALNGVELLTQQFPNNHLGLEWSYDTHTIFTGDFNGDGRSDLYLQAKYKVIILPSSGIDIPLIINPKTLHSILLSDAAGTFTLVNQTWTNDYLGLGDSWMANRSNVIIGDYNGDGRDDILLQGMYSNDSHYILLSDAQGKFTTVDQVWKDGYLGQNWSAQYTILLSGNFNSGISSDLLLQSINSEVHTIVTADSAGTLFTASSDIFNDVTKNGFLTLHESLFLKPKTEFGKVDGSFSINTNGAATYSIPIAVPPGISGMQPSLNLGYSNQTGNGLLGIGWGLSGLSTIARCPQSFAQDGVVTGINFDTSDRFCLDGFRLIAVEGVYGADGTVYRTELEKFSRITSFKDAVDGHISFQVETKAGQIFEYGNSYDSRANNKTINGEILALSWKVNKISDAVGNYMLFIYARDDINGEHYPTQILYTLNDDPASELGSNNNNFLIQFEYEAREDATTGFFSGNKISNTVRMVGIKTYTGGILTRQYHMQYEINQFNLKSRINSIIDCDGLDNCKPVTNFTWSNSQLLPLIDTINRTSYAQNGTILTSDAKNVRFIDMNGDGYTDMCYRDIGINSIICVKGDKNGLSTTQSINTNLCGSDCQPDSIQYLDFNKDGKTDISYLRRGGVEIVLSDGDNFVTHISTGLKPCPSNCFVTNDNVVTEYSIADNYYFMDLDGDQFTDICIREYTGIECHINNGTNSPYDFTPTFYTSICATGTGYCNDADNHTTIQFMDLNQDGKSDLIYRSDIGIQYFYSTGTGFGVLNGTSLCANVQTSADGYCNDVDNHTTIKYPDVNGDSLPDICYRGDNGIRCVLNTGVGFDIASPIVTGFCANGSQAYGACNDGDNYSYIQYTDFNGDGKSDLTFRSDSGLRFFRSTGSNFIYSNGIQVCANQNNPDPTATLCESSDNYQTINYTDMNGDGIIDVSFRGDGGVVQFLSNGIVPDQIETITDGFKNATKITYKPLTDQTVYNGCSGASFPEMCLISPSQVVSDYTASNGVGGVGAYQYTYEGLKIHLRGRGPLGFTKIQKTDLQTNIITTTLYDNSPALQLVDSYPDFYPYRGFVINTQTSLNGNLITDSSNTLVHYATVLGYATPYFPYLKTSIEKTYFFDSATGINHYVTETIKTIDLDNYGGARFFAGNATTVSTSTRDVTTGDVFTNTTVSKFDEDSELNWNLGRLTESTATHTSNIVSLPAGELQAAVKTRTSTFSYYANGLIKTSREAVDLNDPSLEVVTNYSYDIYGHKTTITIDDNAAALYPISQRSSSSNYLAGKINNSAPEIETFNTLGQSEVKTLDARFGTTIQIIGPNKIPTSWQYDRFGRVTKEIRADGTSTITSRIMCGFNCGTVQGVTPTYYVEVETVGSLPTRSYYDQLDRVIRLETTNIEGKTVYRDSKYDPKGRLEKTSLAYFAGDPIYWSYNFYDFFNRVIKVTQDGSSKIIETGYAPLTSKITVTNVSSIGNATKVHTKTEINYANGKVRRVEENVDNRILTNRYAYDVVGNLTAVYSPASSTPVRMFYDTKDRKIAMIDPDMGSWQYFYDAIGNLRKQIDAKGQRTDMVYDDLDRMIMRLENEGATVWQYDIAANGIGKLSKMIGPIELTTTQLTEQRTTPNVATVLTLATAQQFSRQHSYDNLGRANSIVTNIDGTAFVMDTSYDLYSRVELVTYPTNVGINIPTRFAVKNIYNSNGFLIRIENASNQYAYWKLGDTTGNIVSATNAKGQIIMESFGNDVTTINNYNPVTGLLLKRTSGVGSSSSIQNAEYVFDSIGNLENRIDHNQIVSNVSLSESFTYDELNRVKDIKLNNVLPLSWQYSYDDSGNILYNSGFGTYLYNGASGPHAVDTIVNANTSTIINSYSYDANGNMTSDNDRAITYTSFNKPNLITKGSNSHAFYYSGDYTRYKQVTTDGQTLYLSARYDAGTHFERRTENGVSKDVHYIYAGGALVGTYTVLASDIRETRYFHTDYLGSISVITDESAAVRERLSYSPFGQRRNLDWTNSAVQIIAIENHHGFTGHEHLDDVGFIHMNGRVYDPTLGRFISADPNIQYPNNTQGYNRYTYVNNNPLSLTDPSGFDFISNVIQDFANIFHRNSDVIDTGIKLYIGYQIGQAFGGSSVLGSSIGGATTAALTGGDVVQGAAFAAAFATIGLIDVGSDPLKWAVTITAHGVVGGIQSEVQGGSFNQGFWSAAVGKSVTLGMNFQWGKNESSPARFAVTVVSGGITSVMAGGKFGNGAITAAWGYLFKNLTRGTRERKPTFQEGNGGVAFVGGFFDKTIQGPVLQAYQAYTGDKAYFQWYESEALAQWIDANAGNVSIISHSYGADMAAEVVAAGWVVNTLITVDPVGWTRPDFADVAANTGSWINYNAVGGGATWPNFVASIGGAWNNAPSSYATQRNVPYDHVGVCFRYCSP